MAANARQGAVLSEGRLRLDSDVHAYGDMRTNGKQLTIYTPSYGNSHTVRGTLTVVVAD